MKGRVTWFWVAAAAVGVVTAGTASARRAPSGDVAGGAPARVEVPTIDPGAAALPRLEPLGDGVACGSKENPCPMQKWMKTNMSGPNSSGDMPALQAAFVKLAAMAPDKSWNGADPKGSWDAISNAGAAAAKAGDAAGVKAACRSCHDAFKDKYKAQFRTRPVT